MKLKLVLVGLAAALLVVSAAVAAPPPGKGKPENVGPPAGKGKPLPNGPTCKPKVTVVLKGTLNSATSGSLSMKVNRANHWGQAWAKAGSASVTLDENTKVRGNGMKSVDDLAKLQSEAWVLVQARSCKADLGNSAMPTLTAVRVVAHPAHPANAANEANDQDDND